MVESSESTRSAQPCLRAWAMSSSKLGSGRVNHWSPRAGLEDLRSSLSGGRSGGWPGGCQSGAAGMGACWDSLVERRGRGASGSEDSEPGLWRDPSDESPESSESRGGAQRWVPRLSLQSTGTTFESPSSNCGSPTTGLHSACGTGTSCPSDAFHT